ncbi:hypothetical protein [Virgibacillus salexigens]|uniref:hypothetical protein n=1 Tax=Virgibacillus salexigens TaxID=61016 RepID=UPI00190D252D|nr:hypothetical protein [Virgibacillus salexigens]
MAWQLVFGTGVYYYKKLTYEPLMEVYLTDDMINDYIIAGKNGFKIEVGIAIIIVCLFVLAFVLFIVFRWLMCFLISLFLFALLGMLFGSITIERFKFYQKRKSV